MIVNSNSSWVETVARQGLLTQVFVEHTNFQACGLTRFFFIQSLLRWFSLPDELFIGIQLIRPAIFKCLMDFRAIRWEN
jgi:hypothetical protein